MTMRGAIEVVMYGGLGNEMFQYALGRTLSIRSGRPLVLDISLYSQTPGLQLILPCFRLGQQTVRELPYSLWRARTKMLRKLEALGISPFRVIEPSLQFSIKILQIDKSCMLWGYWQSESYFESISERLREEFTIIREQDPRSAACQARIRRGPSIGLHIRRGDYLPAPGEVDFHGTCSKEYYDAALKLARARVGPNPELFVFSDDMLWSRNNIRYDLPTVYVDWNATRPYEDLRLMSQCHALIMANSTFSWWGGWLNSRPDKTVVAPRRWFLAPGVYSDLPMSPWLIAI